VSCLRAGFAGFHHAYDTRYMSHLRFRPIFPNGRGSGVAASNVNIQVCIAGHNFGESGCAGGSYPTRKVPHPHLLACFVFCRWEVLVRGPDWSSLYMKHSPGGPCPRGSSPHRGKRVIDRVPESNLAERFIPEMQDRLKALRSEKKSEGGPLLPSSHAAMLCYDTTVLLGD
jgi:hypothetical protein